MKNLFTLVFILVFLNTYSQCDFTAPYSENFDNVTAPALPDCWSEYTPHQYQSIYTNSSTSYTSPNCVMMNGYIGNVPDFFFVSPMFTDLDNTKQIRFRAAKNNLGDISFKVGVMNDPLDPGSFVLLQNFPLGTITGDWVEYNVSLENYTGTGHYIAISKGQEGSASIFIDNFVYEYQPCYKQVPYSENFDNVTAPALPDCWSEYTPHQYQSIYTNSSTSYTSPNCVMMNGYIGSVPDFFFVSPMFTDLDNTKQIRFRAAKNNLGDISFKVGVMNDPLDPGSFVLLQNFPLGTITNNWVEYIITLEDYMGTGKYIAISKGQEGSASIFIDDFVYELNPTIGINDLSEDFNIFPNPTKDFIYISKDDMIDSYTIYSMSGILLQKSIYESYIDLSNYQTGVYFLIIDSKEGSVTKKIIKQ
jgi:hypothetical protein